MLLDRIIKETKDQTRFIFDFDAMGMLDPGETISLASATIVLGATGWSESPFPVPGAEPYDPTPLLFRSATIDASQTKLVTFVDFGTPGNVYTCLFLIKGTSGRQLNCELAVQVTGDPPAQPLPVPPPSGSQPALALSIYGGTMEGPLYLFEDPLYPTEAATKYYVDHVAGATGGPFLSLSGGQMTGPLLLAEDPAVPTEAATRAYVDQFTAQFTNYLPLVGGTLEGDLLFHGANIVAPTGGTGFSITVHDAPFTIAMIGTTPGNIILSGLPTSDPHVVGALWNSSGVLHVSAG